MKFIRRESVGCGTVPGQRSMFIGFIWLAAVLLIAATSFGEAVAQEKAYHKDQKKSENRIEQSKESAAPDPCDPPPVNIPDFPDKIPGYAQPDPETGLHVTGTPQKIDLDTYTLEIRGLVENPVKFTYDELRCMPRIKSTPTLICPGFFQDTATWAGASLKYVLESAGIEQGAVRMRMVSADGYNISVPIEKALIKDNFLAYELEGKTLPVLHGFPIRVVFPDLVGNKWVKWLIRIEILSDESTR